MPDHSPSTDERASLTQPSQSSSPLECTSHLGFSLEQQFNDLKDKFGGLTKNLHTILHHLTRQQTTP